MDTKQTGGYSVKNVKSMNGNDGLITRANIYRDGVKVGEGFDDGNGGGVMFDFVSPVEEKKFYAFVENLTYVCPFDHKTHPQTPDIFFDEMCNAYELAKETARFEKQRARDMQTKTVFRLKSDVKDSYRIVKHAFDAKVKKYLTDKYGDKLEVIFNETAMA